MGHNKWDVTTVSELERSAILLQIPDQGAGNRPGQISKGERNDRLHDRRHQGHGQ